jgi:hypothetical protein
MISPSQRPVSDNTQHSQEKNIHAPDGIRTHDPNKWTAAELHLRPRGIWDRHLYTSLQGLIPEHGQLFLVN